MRLSARGAWLRTLVPIGDLPIASRRISARRLRRGRERQASVINDDQRVTRRAHEAPHGLEALEGALDQRFEIGEDRREAFGALAQRTGVEVVEKAGGDAAVEFGAAACAARLAACRARMQRFAPAIGRETHAREGELGDDEAEIVDGFTERARRARFRGGEGVAQQRDVARERRDALKREADPAQQRHKPTRIRSPLGFETGGVDVGRGD